MAETPVQDRLLSASEVAEWLRVSPKWVYRMADPAAKDLLPALRLGGTIRFSGDEVQVVQNRVPSLQIPRVLARRGQMAGATAQSRKTEVEQYFGEASGQSASAATASKPASTISASVMRARSV